MQHEHIWPGDLTADSLCEAGCGTRYDEFEVGLETRAPVRPDLVGVNFLEG